jgi:phage terminase small subunit
LGKRGPRSVIDLETPRPQPAPTVGNPAEPPKHLGPDARAWWQAVIDIRTFEEHELRVLLLAAEALDRRQQARAALKEFGLTFADAKGMIRARPEVAIERDSATVFMRVVRALHLDPPPPDTRHPGQIPWYENKLRRGQ